jgi:hypothetical protein
MQFLLEKFSRRKFRHIFRNTDAAFVKLQKFDLLARLSRAEDESNREFFARLHLMLFQPAKVQLHLTFVGGFELIEFQVNGN